MPSPTFTLIQTYDLPRFPVVHADLYRLEGPGELAELGFDDLPKDAVVLLEWPDRAAGFLPPDRIDVAFTLEPKDRPRGTQGAHHRLRRVRQTRGPHPYRSAVSWIRAAMALAERKRIQGDASTRSLRAALQHRRAARHPDELAAAAGRPAGSRRQALQRDPPTLAEDIVPFVAMANGLRQRGFSAPQIYEAELPDGLLIIEKGSRLRAGGRPGRSAERRSRTATPPRSMRWSRCTCQQLPERDPGRAACRACAAALRHRRLSDRARAAARLVFAAARRHGDRTKAAPNIRRVVGYALQVAIDAEPTWVLRDFHSPNLIWLPERQDTARVGLLDFQDAVMGPPAYDVASLLQDARVDVPELMEVALLGHYVQKRAEADAELRAGRPSSATTPRSPRSAPRRYWVFSRGSTGVTASRNIFVTSREYGAICNARWRIPRWRRCGIGTARTCRRPGRPCCGAPSAAKPRDNGPTDADHAPHRHGARRRTLGDAHARR